MRDARSIPALSQAVSTARCSGVFASGPPQSFLLPATAAWNFSPPGPSSLVMQTVSAIAARTSAHVTGAGAALSAASAGTATIRLTTVQNATRRVRIGHPHPPLSTDEQPPAPVDLHLRR